jgi:hypothetical protein
VLALVFGSANPQDVALALLGADRYDVEVEKKDYRNDLLALLASAYDIELSAATTLPEVRDRLARHVLLTDFVTGLGESVPPPLASVKVATVPSGLDLCLTVARNWRLRRDARDSYVTAGHKVEHEYSLGSLDLDPERLRGLETFLAGVRGLLRNIERSLLASPTDELLRLAQSRLSRFWADAVPASRPSGRWWPRRRKCCWKPIGSPRH